MSLLQTFRHLTGDVQKLSSFQRTLLEDLLQRRARHQFHRHKRQVFRLVYLVNRGDAGMVQLRGSSGLLEKALAGLRIGFRVLGKELQRDLTAERQVLGAINSTHPTFAEFSENAIVRDCLADHMSRVTTLERIHVRGCSEPKSTKGHKGVGRPARLGLGRLTGKTECMVRRVVASEK